MLKGEKFAPKVDFVPSFASNKKYALVSSNPSVVNVSGQEIVAVNEGFAYITAIADDNENIQTAIKVDVAASSTKLDSPSAMSFNSGVISFSSVENAVGYTLVISSSGVSHEIDLGNTTQYALSNFEALTHSAYDNLLSVKVRANAPNYTRAFETSDFSAETKIYQSSEVKNIAVRSVDNVSKLSFEHAQANKFNVYINDELWKEGTSEKSIELMNLPSKYAGQIISLQVEAWRDLGENYYPSQRTKINVEVLGCPELNVGASKIEWSAIRNAAGYNVLIDGAPSDEISMLNRCELEISTLNTPALNSGENNHTLTIEPVINRNNLAKTEASEYCTINFNFKKSTTPTFDRDKVYFPAENEIYLISLTQLDGDYSETIASREPEFSFSALPKGRYNFSVVVQGSKEEEDGDIVYYFSSSPTEKIIEKKEFEDYKLNLSASVGEKIKIMLDGSLLDDATYSSAISGASISEGVLTANETSVSINFKNITLPAGAHSINAFRMEEDVEGELILAEFTQLEEIPEIKLENETATVELTATNQNADAIIRFEVFASEESKFSHDGATLNFNTTNASQNDFLSAGEYTIKVLVLGNGSTTFSVREAGEDKKMADAEFTVLAAPTLRVDSTAVDGTKATVNFNEIAQAVNYKVFEKVDDYREFTSTNDAHFDFNLDEGKICFAVRAIGAGNVISSNYSEEIKIKRLKTQQLSYNKLQDKFEITDDNDSQTVLNYAINESVFEDKNLENFKPKFTPGENALKIVAHAKTGKQGDYFYLDSKESELIVEKIENTGVKVEICQDENFLIAQNGNYLNHIKVSLNDEGEFKLILKFNILGQTLTFNAANDQLVCTSLEKNYSLPFAYEENCFYISLLNADLSPIIKEMANSKEESLTYTLEVQLASVDDYDNLVASDAVEKELKTLPQSSINRDGEKISFKNVDASRSQTGYAILLDGQYLLKLDEENVLDKLGQFEFDFNYLSTKAQEFMMEFEDEVEHSISIITLSTDDQSVICLSKNFKFARSKHLEISSSKNLENPKVSSSVIISFKKVETDYASKEYIVNLFSGDMLSHTLKFTDANADESGTISFELDNEDLVGPIRINAYLSTSGTMGDEVNLFNSALSNELNFIKIAQATNLTIDNGMLNFQCVDNDKVAFYEIYREAGEKIGTTRTCQFDLFNLEYFATTNLQVRAVSVEELDGVYYTNADLSLAITAIKLNAPQVAVENGDFVLTIQELKSLQTLFGNGNAHIKANEKEIFENQPGVVFDYNLGKVYVEAYVLLSYGESVVSEQLTFQIIVNGFADEGLSTHYINSATSSISVSGLLQPIKLKVDLIETEDSETVDTIVIENNSLNPQNGISYSYIMRVTYLHTGEEQSAHTYSTLQGKFYYYETEINSQATFAENAVKLPTKFVPNGGREILFAEGSYLVEIKVVAVGGETIYCSSNYAKVKIDILSQVSPSVLDGSLVWRNDPLAQGYSIKIAKNGEDENAKILHTTSNSFDFTAQAIDDLTGVLSVQVKAVSHVKNSEQDGVLENRINSVWSDKYYVYRLDKASLVEVDDGSIVLSATEYFSTASFNFTNGATNPQVNYDAHLEKANELIAALESSSWDSPQGEDVAKVSLAKRQILDVDYDKFNIPSGIEYSLSVGLKGNTVDRDADTLPFVNSPILVTDLKVTKITSAESVAKKQGELYFNTDQNVAVEDFNHKFDEEENPTLSKAKIFRITITMGSESYPIYAFDYDTFISLNQEGTYNENIYLEDQHYGSLYAHFDISHNAETLRLNVFKNNTIDFNVDSVYYNKITVQDEEGNFVYKMEGAEPVSLDLSQGGVFNVSTLVLGGDSKQVSENHTAYITSSSMIRNFKRYAQNALSTSRGELRMVSLAERFGEEDVIDFPVYKVIAESNLEEAKTFFLYYNGKEDALKVTDDPDEQKGIYEKITLDTDGYIWFAISKHLTSGRSYRLRVQTLAGLTESEEANYLLDSSLPTKSNFEVHKLTSPTLSAYTEIGACLRVQKGYAQVGGLQAYTDNYEITLTNKQNGQQYVYSINQESEGVRYSSGYLLYTLPSQIEVNGEPVSLDSTATYSIKFRAMGLDTDEGQNILNGDYGEEMSVQKANSVLEAKIENGILKYKVDPEQRYNGAYIQISYLVEDGAIKALYEVTQGKDIGDGWYSYEFKDDVSYHVENLIDYESVNSSHEYTIKIYLLGYQASDVIVFNSDLSLGFTTQRLTAVDREQIVATDGVLTWNSIEDAVNYEIKIVGDETYERSETNTSLDLTDIKAGDYQISIKAIGSNRINAVNSTAAQSFKKLQEVDKQTIRFNMTTVSWDDVDGAKGYDVVFNYTKAGAQTETTVSVQEASCEMPEGVEGKFTISIQARAREDKYTLNSSIVNLETTPTAPAAPSAIRWDEQNARFVITTTDDFGESDKIELNFTVQEFTYSSGVQESSQTTSLGPYYVNYSADAANTYYYYPSQMGRYISVSARVDRTNSLSSQPIHYTSLVFNIFSAGNGDDKPYIIANMANLTNIHLRPNAKYELAEDVDISRISASSLIAQYGALLADEFSGSFDGSHNGINHTIKGFNLSFVGSEFALFKTLKNATIKNLTLGSSEGDNLTISGSGQLKVGLLAINSIGSTIEKVNINNTTISVYGSVNTAYVGGLLAQAQGTTFTDCIIDLTINTSSSTALLSTGEKYIGGLVAYVEGGKISQTVGDSSQFNYIGSDRARSIVTYLGGIVGRYKSTKQSKGTLQGVKIDVNMTDANASNLGGVAGQIEYVEMSGAEVTTKNSNKIQTLDMSASSSINLGGLVGKAQSSSITNSGVNVVFSINLLVTTRSEIRIGVLVGELSRASSSEDKNTLSNCYSYTQFISGETKLDQVASRGYGVYGFSATDSTNFGSTICEARS